MSIIRLFFCVAVMLFSVSAAQASALTEITGCKKSPCHPKVDFYTGGTVEVFENAAEELKARNWTIVLKKWVCASSCSLLAALAPKNVCLGYKKRNRVFGFHLSASLQTNDGTSVQAGKHLTGRAFERWKKKHGVHVVGYKKMDYPPLIDTWVGNQGGYPKTEDLLVMSLEDALALGRWHKC